MPFIRAAVERDLSSPARWRGRRVGWQRAIAFAALAALSVLAAGCASLPPSGHEMPTQAIADYARTPIAAITAPALPTDGRSGFRLQPYGPNAFATRLELARLATRSLDVQYYLLQGDNAGRALMRELRDAAARGVRVRVLVDDLYTVGEDELLLGLAAHANVQVRLFNPFPGGRGSEITRFISSGREFDRVNRRMHNKLFVADNAAAVAGGRNMADEYVSNSLGRNFIDMDVFVAGPVVRELSGEFDHYWNSELVFPVQRIASSALGPAELRASFESATRDATAPKASAIPADGRTEHPTDGEPTSVSPDLVEMLNLPFELARHRLGPLLPAHARVLFDPLAKTEGWNERQDSITGTVTEGVIGWLETARTSIKMVSPYFVPSDKGVASLVRGRAQGVAVELVTNSLASTDEPVVYFGYWPHVRTLLKGGVEIRELSPSLSSKRHKLGLFGRRTGALHMKNVIVDRRQVFLGSMNLDQRSAKLNTELGLIIDSAEMARQLDAFTDAGSFYRLRLNAQGDVEWVEDAGDGTPIVHDVPPETTAWQRFTLRLMGAFVPDSEL
jgi:phosphatidylserine/phosphatidylglycerophosphate/cardiolipin synthase-like enzyme